MVVEIGHRGWPFGESEMARLIRSFDWIGTPLGAIEAWPQCLRTVVDLMLDSPGMMSLVWGSNAIHLYNDGFGELLHDRRTQALGRSAFETFARSRDVFAADVAAGMAGRSARLMDQRYPVLRDGRLVDGWFDVDYAPVRDERGQVAGVLWTLKETTKQIDAERALRESEARQSLLIGAWAQAVWETDADGVVVVDSPSWRAYTGQTLREWLGYGWINAIHPDDRGLAERKWREAIAVRGLVNAEFRLRAPDGGWRWTNVRAAPVLDPQGQIAKWAGMNFDIDARKQAEEALRASEERFRSFAENSTDALWIIDARTRQLAYLSPAFERIWAERRTVVLNDLSRWAGLVHPDDRERAAIALPRALAGESVQIVYRIRRADDGQIRWIQDTGFPIQGPDGEIDYVGGISQDVTKERETAERLQENQRRLWTLIQGIPQLVWRATNGGEWTWASPQWLDYTGQSLEESCGFGWLNALHPDDREEARAGWSRADGFSHIDMETRLFHAREGRHRWFQTRALPVRDEEGRIVEWLGTSTDIDDIRQLQQRQQVLVAELQHRTRNLIGVVWAISEKTAEETGHLPDFLALFHTRLGALARINSLLSKLDSGERVTFDALLRTELEARGFLDDGLSEQVVLDGPKGVRLRSATVQTFALALHELITNAVKYGALSGRDGRLNVTWRVRNGDAGTDNLYVEWRESGVANMALEGEAARGSGYGRTMIEQALPYQLDAETTFKLRPDGVHCTIDLPLQ